MYNAYLTPSGSENSNMAAACLQQADKFAQRGKSAESDSLSIGHCQQ
jgi:hypothetical protein